MSDQAPSKRAHHTFLAMHHAAIACPATVLFRADYFVFLYIHSSRVCEMGLQKGSSNTDSCHGTKPASTYSSNKSSDSGAERNIVSAAWWYGSREEHKNKEDKTFLQFISTVMWGLQETKGMDTNVIYRIDWRLKTGSLSINLTLFTINVNTSLKCFLFVEVAY